jgi:hypothetical protein
MQILATHRALFGAISADRRTRTISEADLVRVVEVFQANRARWALVGAHAIGLLTQPRATADFEFILDGAKIPAVLADLAVALGELGATDVGAAIQLRSIDVDLIRSTNHPLFAEALKQMRTVGEWNVPRTEALIALKFLAAVSPWRNPDKRAQDIVDLRTTYRAVGRDALDIPDMVRLAGLAYPGAEDEFRALIDKIDRGEPISI